LAEAAAGEGVEVTPEELDEWERTGELPASVEGIRSGNRVLMSGTAAAYNA
jgi:hypothetical protein